MGNNVTLIKKTGFSLLPRSEARRTHLDFSLSSWGAGSSSGGCRLLSNFPSCGPALWTLSSASDLDMPPSAPLQLAHLSSASKRRPGEQVSSPGGARLGERAGLWTDLLFLSDDALCFSQQGHRPGIQHFLTKSGENVILPLCIYSEHPSQGQSIQFLLSLL